MFPPTRRTDSVQIEISLSASVMTPTLTEHLTSLVEHTASAGGTILVRPAGGGQWSGSVQFEDGDGLTYEAAMGDSVESVLVQLRGRIGA